MPIKHAIWTVGDKPAPLALTKLATEKQLEDMIAADQRIVSAEWMLIGRQEHTPFSGILDLLAIASRRSTEPATGELAFANRFSMIT
jgi:hypothetical protein